MFADLFLIGDGLSWLESLDKQALLDLNGSDSLYLDRVAKGLTNAFTWIPLYISLFYIVLKNNENVQKVLMVLGAAALCVLLAGTVDDLIVKPMVGRWRPTRDPEIGMLVDIVDGYRGGRFGFFSAHAANTFSIAVFFCWLVRSKLLSVALVTWSLINCWTRLYLGVHFPGDILVGLLWGFLVATTVYYIFLRVSRPFSLKRHLISSQYTMTGYQRTDCDIPVAVLLFTIVIVMIKSCIL
jgi:undecaprenyl-diphosphatase